MNNNPIYWYQAAKDYLKLADDTNALKCFQKAIQLEPGFIEAHYLLGRFFFDKQQLDNATKQFQNVIVLDSDYLPALFYLGTIALTRDALDDAFCYFKAVLAINENHIETLVNLGIIYLKREEQQQAVDYFSKALTIDNNHIEARNNLAAIFMHYDRFENALTHYEILLQKDPANIEYLYNSGVARMAIGNLNEAVLCFEKLLEQKATHIDSLNNLAAIYIKLENPQKAIMLLKQSLNVNPNDKISQFMLCALTRQNCTASPPAYAKNLFDNYALYYDSHLKNKLHYQVPERIAKLLHEQGNLSYNQVLDLGCGTGLTGNILREMSQHLTGVDISEKMTAIAKEKGLYDNIYNDEILEFLSNAPKKYYDLVVSADVLPYFGDLGEYFEKLSGVVPPGGKGVFNVEITIQDNWKLQETMRFSHNPNYIQQLCDKHQFEIVSQKEITARYQKESPLTSLLYLIMKRS